MTGYPHRYGTSAAATRHYAIACVASAAILRREGHPDAARDLEAAARHPDPDPALDQPSRDEPSAKAGQKVPSWWR